MKIISPVFLERIVRLPPYAAGGTGFEPAFRYNPENRLAGGPIRPLWHPPIDFPQAEGVGFEPTVPETDTQVFKTSALSHSAIPPEIGTF